MQAEWKSNAISNAQLEAVTLAMQRFTAPYLEDGSRPGFFLGDGAGVGKGRTISAIVKQCYRNGSRRFAWFSVANDLREDARRDMADLGIHVPSKEEKTRRGEITIDVQPYGNQTPPSDQLPNEMLPKGGIFFSTYCLLIAGKNAQGLMAQVAAARKEARAGCACRALPTVPHHGVVITTASPPLLESTCYELETDTPQSIQEESWGRGGRG